MKRNRTVLALAVALFVMPTAPLRLVAQEHNTEHHHYKLIDMGTFGGPGGGIVNPSTSVINKRGALVGVSETSAADPFAPNCFFGDCHVAYGWLWQDGMLTNLGTLPNGFTSLAAAINNQGTITGQAENGSVDPTTGWPETVTVLWKNGKIRNLGTLGGTQSDPNAINNRGQVVGAALTANPDPFANSPLTGCVFMPTSGYAPGCKSFTFAESSVFFPATTESHAFLWEKGVMDDLGTLGGPDSDAWIINDRGLVAGFSFTSYVANPSTGVPTVDPFLWDPATGKMTDLGGLGGTMGAPQWMNHRGQIVGSSNLPGDTGNHPFLWSNGKMTDLKVFSETNPFGVAFSINDAGEVVGTAGSSPGLISAFFWKKGTMLNLGTVDGDPCSQAFSINEESQVVGVSDDCSTGADLHGFLWEPGGSITDLNKLLVNPSSSTVVSAVFINDGGEIGCLVQHADGSGNGCVLIPCDDDHPGVEGCDYSFVEANSAISMGSMPIRQEVTNGNQSSPRFRELRNTMVRRSDRRLVP